MRLRLFERLGRLVGWRPGSQGDGSGRPGDTRADGAEASGKHRRNVGAGTGQPRLRPPVATARQRSAMPPPTPPMQPPAGLPRRSSPRGGAAGQGPVPRYPNPRAGGPALPPLPRNYSPTAGQGPGQGAGQGAGRGAGRPAAAGGGIGRARIREAPPFGAAPVETPTREEAVTRGQDGASQAPGAPRQPWYQVVGEPADRAQARQAAAQGTGAQRTAAQAARQAAVSRFGPAAARAQVARNPGMEALAFAAPHPRDFPVIADGRRHCGPLENILWRLWDAATTAPPPQAIAAIERLAEFPRALQQKLADGLDGIYVGAGGVPDLDDMGGLHGVQLPSGKATWDACAGAYGDRKIVVGTRPSPTPDVMCHEVGHALDDLDSPPGKWQSDSPEFKGIYDQCQPYIASDFHRQRGGLGRKEFFADSFAAIASAQRPALVDMLSGNTRLALQVMLYFNRRYGI